ncbi:hypothetical protein [Microvirus mar33]|uniref:Uncharacterized protein n=1 Tax=Microvirus mar33 TaxID=2851167 RepID=A0A8F5RC18_9VIRU|nr:hypothetical protein [Microvirus mar33]
MVVFYRSRSKDKLYVVSADTTAACRERLMTMFPDDGDAIFAGAFDDDFPCPSSRDITVHFLDDSHSPVCDLVAFLADALL